jgi:drug/metabolite transporter (DMT)-like permease
MRAIAERQRLHLAECAWFWTWALVGGAFALGAVSLGPLLLLPATFAVVLITRRRPIRGAFGLMSGVGAVLLVIAYLQRQGPGTTCTQTTTSITCEQHLNPIPWLVVGLLCFAAGIVGHVRQRA